VINLTMHQIHLYHCYVLHHIMSHAGNTVKHLCTF